MKTKCEVCLTEFGSDTYEINLGLHPLCDDLLSLANRPDGLSVHRYEQRIRLCSNCLTAHQMSPVEKELLFKSDYKYRSSLTKDVISGMKQLVEDVCARKSLKSKSIVLDVGCNDGSLLQQFKTRVGARTVGVDPTNSINDSGDHIDHKYQAFFDESVARMILDEVGVPDIITFTNVFAHIEDLQSLLRAVNILMGPDTLLVIENHYLGSILETHQFDTFYHEHPRTYSARSFAYVADSLSASVVDIQFPSRYGGNIRVLMQRSPSVPDSVAANIFPDETAFVSRFQALQTDYDSWKLMSQGILRKLLKAGPVVGKGLPGRAVMLISSLGLTSEDMPFVFEQESSPKVGHYVPGTDISVKSDAFLPRNPDQVIIIWAWHIAEEIRAYLKNLGIPGEYWVPLPEWKMIRDVE